jgi:hypothetical protein
MLEHTFVRTGVIARLRRSPLGPYLDSLATALHREGYAPSSIQRFLCAAEQFAHWVHGQGYAVSEMDADLVHRYLSRLPRYRSGNLPKAAQGLRYLVRFLHQHGIACPRHARPPTPPLEQWLSAYDTHLAHVAGLALSTSSAASPTRIPCHCIVCSPLYRGICRAACYTRLQALHGRARERLPPRWSTTLPLGRPTDNWTLGL